MCVCMGQISTCTYERAISYKEEGKMTKPLIKNETERGKRNRKVKIKTMNCSDSCLLFLSFSVKEHFGCDS